MTDTFRNLEHTKTAQWFSSTLLVVTNQKSHSTNFNATLVHDPWDPSLFCSLFSILRLQFVKLIQKRGFYEWYHIKSSSLAKSGIESWECTTSNACFFRLSPDREEEDSISLWIKQNWFRISIDEAMTPQKSLILSHFQTLRLLNSNGWSCNELHGTNMGPTRCHDVNPSTLEDNCGSDLLRTSTWPQLREKHDNTMSQCVQHETYASNRAIMKPYETHETSATESQRGDFPWPFLITGIDYFLDWETSLALCILKLDSLPYSFIYVHGPLGLTWNLYP